MAEWHFCEECGHCFLAMDCREKYCSDECRKALIRRLQRKYPNKKTAKAVVLKEIAKKICIIRNRALTPDRIEELRELADALIDFCDEKEGIRVD